MKNYMQPSNRVDKETFWNVLKNYDVRGQLLVGMKVFYREESVCVMVDGELNEGFSIGFR